VSVGLSRTIARRLHESDSRTLSEVVRYEALLELNRQVVAQKQELERLNNDLADRNAELVRKNAELEEANLRTKAVFAALSEVLPGTVLDETYRLDVKIGEGGFGAVFRGLHLGLDRAVAIKVL